MPSGLRPFGDDIVAGGDVSSGGDMLSGAGAPPRRVPEVASGSARRYALVTLPEGDVWSPVYEIKPWLTSSLIARVSDRGVVPRAAAAAALLS